MINGPGTTAPAVVAYIASVREGLGDLRAADVEDILEDVREDVHQVALEYGDEIRLADLIERLGAPAEYIAELRAAAGIEASPAVDGPARARFARRLLRVMASGFLAATAGLAALTLLDVVFGLSGAPAMFGVPAVVASVAAGACLTFLVLGQERPLDELVHVPGVRWIGAAERQIREMPWGPAAIDFVASLQPGWWVVRAAIVGLAAAYLGTPALGAVTFVAALAVSIRFGRRGDADIVSSTRRLVIYGANAAIVVGGAFVVLAIGDDLRHRVVYADPGDDYYADGTLLSGEEAPQMDDPYPVGFMTPNGLTMNNVYAYDADGDLLENVRLYGSNGQPLVLPVNACEGEGLRIGERLVVTNPWGTNVYPRPVYEVDDHHECQPVTAEAPYGDRLPAPAGAEIPDAPAESPSAVPVPSSTPTGFATPTPHPSNPSPSTTSPSSS